MIGSGVAGMSFALQAAKFGTVAIVTKADARESNSNYAQGGIAAVWDDDDSFENHIRDTLVAGAGLCDRSAVEQTVREGPKRVAELIEMGTEFTRRDDDVSEYSLHREGGHSHRRILHAADLTGAEMVRALATKVASNPNITLHQHHMAIDLITSTWLARRRQEIPPASERILGAYVLDQQSTEVQTFSARAVVLATGGAGKLYQFTTNPDVATGDGMAMAYRAGARMANLEFVQFHPTCLYNAKVKSFLITEALRGEGGKLVHADGDRFMKRYDERMELAPRDIVARAIDAEIKRLGLECVYLDMTHLDAQHLETHFPNIFAKLASVGINMATDPIPVVPAAHYFCGGVKTDLNGVTSIENLLCVGETSCTGLHGANRLASNSLLEAVVFAHTAANYAEEHLPVWARSPEIPEWDAGSSVDSDELVVIKQVWEEIRRFMWNYVGIVRTHRRLKRARRRIQLVQEEIAAYYWDFRITGDLIELRNLATVADVVVQCALQRRESRGLHYTLDFPETDDRFIGDSVVEKR